MTNGRQRGQNAAISEVRERTISIHSRFADILPGVPDRDTLECHMFVEAARLKDLLPLVIKSETVEKVPKTEITAVHAALDRLELLVELLHLAVLDEPGRAGPWDEQVYVDRLRGFTRPELAELLRLQAGLSLATDPAELMRMLGLAPGLLAGTKETLLKIIKLILLAVFLMFWYWKIVDINNFVKLLQKFIEWDDWGEGKVKPKDVAPPLKSHALHGVDHEGNFLAHMHLVHCDRIKVPNTEEFEIYHLKIRGGPYGPPPPVVEVRWEKNGPVKWELREGEVINVPCTPEIWLHLKYKPHRSVNVRVWTD